MHEHVTEIVAGFATDMPLTEYERRLEELEDELADARRGALQAPILAQRGALDEELAALEQD